MAELDRPKRPVPRPLPAVLAGANADVYFLRTEQLLAAEGRNPIVSMEVFARVDGATLCGIDEVKGLLAIALESDAAAGRADLWALADGDQIAAKEVVLRIRAPYRSIAHLETSYLGALSHGTGWATAARKVVAAAGLIPVVAFGARHVHPNIADRLDYAAIVGGAIGASTPSGSARHGIAPVGTMPHALILLYGDTVEAALAFDRSADPEVPRIVLVDTLRDESEESTRVAAALGARGAGAGINEIGLPLRAFCKARRIRTDAPLGRGRLPPRADLSGSERGARIRFDALDHGAHTIRSLWREMGIEAEACKQRLCIGLDDLARGAARIKCEH
jgi:nicotinic acid phosphoribosyltransferase